MATFINVTSGGDELLSRQKQQQLAQRLAQQDTQRRKQLTGEIATQDNQRFERQGRGLELRNNKRDLAAYRSLKGGSVMAVDAQPVSNGTTFTLTIGPPNQLVSATATTPEPSGSAASNQPPTTDTSSGPNAVLGFLTTSVVPDFFGFNWRTQYPCGTTFQGGPGAAPLTSNTDSRTSRVVIQNFEDSQGYLLPVGNKVSIYVYVYSKLRTLTVYESKNLTARTSVNQRIVTSGCGSMPGTYYDRETIFTAQDTFDNIEQRQAYQIFAFVVTETTVRQLTVPPQLDTAIRSLHPPMVVNDTTTVTNSSVYTRYEYSGPSAPLNYNGPVTYGTTTVPAFSMNKHRQTSLHGDYKDIDYSNDILAKQFGIGYLNENYHGGPFFSPAVYTFLTTPMNLSDSENAQSYSYMRSTYFSSAANKYLAPCVISGSCVDNELVSFDISTASPVNVFTDLPASNFSSSDRYKLQLNGAYDYNMTYAWDGDRPSYCKQQLQLLGFTSADFV